MTVANTMKSSKAEREAAEEREPESLQPSPVQRMFEGRSVFITGASGFIGRVLLEKLLRCYPGIKRVYILMRAKKNMAPAERLHKQLLKVPIFDQLRALKNGPELLEKIVVVTGDIGNAQLGLSEQDLNMLLADETLAVVFHSAATVKFDEPLNTSVKFNLVATQAMIALCKRLPNLVALCHVSTAYVNSDQTNCEPIEETIYPMKQTAEQVIKLSELVDDELMQHLQPTLVGERPNTYTFTKALGEHLIALEAADLPVAIVRPSIVVAAWKEPLPGWIDNLNGPTGLILAIGKGLLRSMHTRRACKADVIPVDIVVNTMIAASFYAAQTSGKLAPQALSRHLSERAPSNGPAEVNDLALDGESALDARPEGEQSQQSQQSQAQLNEDDGDEPTTRVPPIFHCTSGDLNPITWGNMEDMFFPIIREYPSIQVLRYPFGTFKSNRYHDMVTRWFVHFLPALIIDLLCLVMGKKRQLLSIYLKLHAALGALSHFSTTNYNFKSRNIAKLQACLTHPLDQAQLYMDIRPLDWRKFWHAYVLGARRYVLKEDDCTLEESRRSFKRALYLEYAFRALLLLLGLLLAAPLARRAAPYLAQAISPTLALV